ncbi:hypothetical protein [Streptomyces cucumeris]|uniref:hypothetical protein n=1 Tax=Streptomyces cucumeris TaxID=2962890 RepID=UPI0020C8BA5C|nr:hypothetical protein [Streptomyces sp. NEAU-Y11]MCP9213242.1 hypothetical protein [Streptomyces sp. NEAU-Y11]
MKYWAFTQPGMWTHKVADLGSTTKVLQTTWRIWHPDTYPRTEETAKILCDQCHEAAARARQKAEQDEAGKWRREKEEAKTKEQAATQAR